jgi:hypothetical protein
MSVVAIATVVLAGILIAALAFYLLWVIYLLWRVRATLDKVSFGVAAIAHRTEPLDPILDHVNQRLVAVAAALEGLVAKLRGDDPSARAS